MKEAKKGLSLSDLFQIMIDGRQVQTLEKIDKKTPGLVGTVQGIVLDDRAKAYWAIGVVNKDGFGYAFWYEKDQPCPLVLKGENQ